MTNLSHKLRIGFAKGWPPVLAIILLLITWQICVTVFQVEKWLLPSPLQIVQEGYAIAPRLWMHTWSTLKICVVGFAVGVTCGILIAMLMHLVKPIKVSLSAILITTQNIPTIVLAPLLVVWFGFGLLPKVIVIALVCFFPIAVSMLNGLAETNYAILNYMRMIGAKRHQLFLKLELPHALPYLFSGLKISATYSVMGAVISEWLGASQGLGHFMTLSSSAYRTDRVFAAIFIVVLLSLALFACIVLIERWVIRWNPGRGREDE
jgi:ABC-type nitrate/sulfonate/bicarbonate transport system permease component